MLLLAFLTCLLAVVNAGLMPLNPRQGFGDNDGIFPPNQTYPGTRIIPVKEVGCWSEAINSTEVSVAKQKLVRLGISRHISAAGLLGETYKRWAVWVCNCKRFMVDHIDSRELDEAQILVAMRCGENRSGWVWSYKWQKSFNFGRREMFLEKKHPTFKKPIVHLEKCPRYCLLEVGDPGLDPNDPDDGQGGDQGDDVGDYQGGDDGDDQNNDPNNDRDNSQDANQD
ncbi:hypothetical protein F4803DRAFT_508176, partial [Xylaria telfairii]